MTVAELTYVCYIILLRMSPNIYKYFKLGHISVYKIVIVLVQPLRSLRASVGRCRRVEGKSLELSRQALI